MTGWDAAGRSGNGMSIAQESGPPKVSLLYDPKVRSIAYQVVLCAVIIFLAYSAVRNAADNLARAKIASGFGFWNQTAGFDISQTLIEYTAQSGTYGRAFWVGLLNTLLVAAIGIVLATIVGFVVGIARLSRNWLISKLAASYVELIRNLPLLLQLLFWYNAVLKALPDMRDSLGHRPPLSQQSRFLFSVAHHAGPLHVGGGGVRDRRRRRDRLSQLGAQEAGTDRRAVAGRAGRAGIDHRPAGRCLLPHRHAAELEYPEKGRFNIRGGLEILPEFVALLFGLATYTAAFIAEVVRAGILAVSKGQTEAADALGLRAGPTLGSWSFPQAMRVIIPPLTNQYLNLTKNSSLAVFVGYPDLVQVFTGTVLEPDRPGGRGRGDHDGGLSHHQPCHLDGDELVQRAHCDR